MKQNKRIFNQLLRRYDKYLRKRKNLILLGRNERRQAILAKHIERLYKQLMSLKLIIQKGSVVATVAVGALAFAPQVGDAQNFIAPQTNPFSLTSTGGGLGSPSFFDLDNDGDLDVIAMDASGNFFYYKNIGTPTVPKFAAAQQNPFNLTALSSWTDAHFVDLDNDGDADLMAADDGAWFYYKNTGSASVPAFALSQTNPFGLATQYDYSVSEFKDLDNDGDLDMMTGDYYGNFTYYENTGTATVPNFAAAQQNPFNLSYIGTYYAAPSLADIDNDGDFDLMAGRRDGNFFYYENTGTATVPNFAAAQQNPFNLTGLGVAYATPTFADLDNDGDLDLMSNNYNGEFIYFENCSSPAIPLNTNTVAELLVCTSGSATLTGTGNGTISWYDAVTGGTYLGGGNSFTTPTISVNTTYYIQDSTSCDVSRIPVAVTIQTPANPIISIVETPIIPVNVANGGAASAGSFYGGNPPSDAFNGDSLTAGWASDFLVIPDSLAYDFGTGNGKVISEYRLYSSSLMIGGWNSTTYLPTEWTFEGFNGTTWDTLDTQTGVTPVLDVWANYPISNTIAYEKYRLFITANGGSSYIAITEVQLLEQQMDICSKKTFDASINTNANPASYQWQVNGANVGTNSDSFLFTNYLENDTVTCTVTTTGVCTVSSSTATSNQIIVAGGAVNIMNNYNACFGDSVLVGAVYFKSDTTFSDVFPLVNGCDSTITSVVTIGSAIDTSTVLSNLTITSNQAGATYRWLECNNSNAVIPTETNVSYTATVNGDYAVEVTKNGCSDTSACVSITTVGLSNLGLEMENLKLYPNPTTGNVVLDLGSIKNAQVSVVDIAGKEVYSWSAINESKLQISSAKFSKGVYFVKVQSSNQQKIMKLIKQ